MMVAEQLEHLTWTTNGVACDAARKILGPAEAMTGLTPVVSCGGWPHEVRAEWRLGTWTVIVWIDALDEQAPHASVRLDGPLRIDSPMDRVEPGFTDAVADLVSRLAAQPQESDR